MSATAHEMSRAEAYARQKVNYTNRASAIFPLRLREASDLRIVFLDYWKIKNGIDRVLLNVRLYDGAGKCLRHVRSRIEEPHNDISMRGLVGHDVDGMVEVEFISTENLVFSFPGIIALYEGKGAVSAVHSAGRTRNPEESFKASLSEETNWTCKVTEGVTPFFHLFNGPRRRQERSLEIRLFDRSGATIGERVLDGLALEPFSSQIVYFDETFDKTVLHDVAFASVSVVQDEVFPRLVVGNFHRRLDLLEVTHSFPHLHGNIDYVPPADADHRLLSFMAFPQPPELELSGVVFPTNAAASVHGDVRIADAPLTSLRQTSDSVTFDTSRGGLFEYRAPDAAQLAVIDFPAGTIPSRFNLSRVYRVRGGDASFSTDIASGAKAWTTPPKTSHWGHGLVSREFDTVVMIVNVSHRISQGGDARGVLTIYHQGGGESRHPISIGRESVTFVNVRALLPALATIDAPATVSWFLKMESAGVDAFWISYAPDGRICGDHAF